MVHPSLAKLSLREAPDSSTRILLIVLTWALLSPEVQWLLYFWVGFSFRNVWLQSVSCGVLLVLPPVDVVMVEDYIEPPELSPLISQSPNVLDVVIVGLVQPDPVEKRASFPSIGKA